MHNGVVCWSGSLSASFPAVAGPWELWAVAIYLHIACHWSPLRQAHTNDGCQVFHTAMRLISKARAAHCQSQSSRKARVTLTALCEHHHGCVPGEGQRLGRGCFPPFSSSSHITLFSFALLLCLCAWPGVGECAGCDRDTRPGRGPKSGGQVLMNRVPWGFSVLNSYCEKAASVTHNPTQTAVADT